MISQSKEGQDIFVMSLIKEPGFYLDIGAAEPIENNNTYSLQQKGWQGILIDANSVTIEQCKTERIIGNQASAVCVDVRAINWKAFLHFHNVPNTIDYISLDVDDANIQVIQNFPLDDYEFKVMTFETDLYSNSIRQQVCEQVLSDYPQYIRILKNAQVEDGRPWEDWYINQDYFDESVLKLQSKNMYWKDFLDKLK